jgi:hypothetical protein
MTLKRTDLEKMMERKISRDLAGENRPDRFGAHSSEKSSQRKPTGLLGALLKKRDGNGK